MIIVNLRSGEGLSPDYGRFMEIRQLESVRIGHWLHEYHFSLKLSRYPRVCVSAMFQTNTDRCVNEKLETPFSLLFSDYSWKRYATKDLRLCQDVIIRSSKHRTPQLVRMIEIANCCSASPLERSTSAYGYRPHGFNPSGVAKEGERERALFKGLAI